MVMQSSTAVKPVKGLSKGATVFTFLLGILMGALDHGIVGPALSSIMAEFNLRSSWGVWSFTAYTLLFAVSIPVLGKLSDRFGRKQTFIFGISMFAVGSIIAAAAPNFAMFLVGRAVQAIGTGGIFPITGAQIAVSYPPERRGRMLGLIGMVFGLGTVLGPVIGGLILERFAWQWIFLINVPVSIAILLLISGVRQEQPIVNKPIDFIGIFLLTVLILSMMLGITSANMMFVGIGLVLIPVLVMVERRTRDPVLNLRYFTKSGTLTLLASSLISGFVMASSTNLIPYFSETVLGMDKGAAGMSVTPLAIASVAASLIGGYLADKTGAKRTLLLGFAITLVAGAMMASGVGTLALFYSVVTVMGFGIGIIIGAPLNVLILQAVDHKETGTAVGYISLFRSLGSAMGPTVAGLFLSMYDNGFVPLFAVSAIGSALSILLLLLFVRKKPAKVI
ncbi:MFS transporter [Paenibacillus mesophilus]|uniref:MFS transporter n=1 Tax=Paenibacillus mesophilus TaxID=2582849 RepID=UPI00110DB043|nr:MFS transporter [Paenibacillus mesophilus]TMV49140.1 MFS transporter [Paenibacillus mesophilus]